jgi:hypothetical protein
VLLGRPWLCHALQGATVLIHLHIRAAYLVPTVLQGQFNPRHALQEASALIQLLLTVA